MSLDVNGSKKTCQAIEVHKARWWLRLCMYSFSLPLHGEMIQFELENTQMTTEQSLLVVPCIFTDVTDVGQYWVQTCNSQATLNLSGVGSGFLPVVDGLSSKKATQAQAAWIVNNLNGFAAKFRSIQS